MSREWKYSSCFRVQAKDRNRYGQPCPKNKGERIAHAGNKGSGTVQVPLAQISMFIVLVLAVIVVALYSFFQINPWISSKQALAAPYKQVLDVVEESNQKIIEISSRRRFSPDKTCYLVGSYNCRIHKLS